MINTGKLAGKTVFITGASRGIGKSIALKVAQDGANVVIAAKTATPHPKLPGTIYTTAEEVEKAGGNALPCIVDVRDECQIQNAVEAAVKKFGGIDILINNASAISTTDTEGTDMKRYDLMHNINTRGTFLVSKVCLPYLKKSSHAHILNMSPPLLMLPRWFGPHLAYTMAKYGMSMCVLGMHEEFKPFNIGVNALWPQTAIHTAAIEMLFEGDSGKYCRKPEILADAAYSILIKDPKTTTGNFFIDEQVLASEGIDLDQYAVDVANKNSLIPDFFIEESSITPPSVKDSDTVASSGNVPGLFKKIESSITPEIVEKTQAVYQFEVTGGEAGKWFIDLKNGAGSCGTGAASSPDSTLKIDSNNLLKLFSGQLKTTTAYATGKLQISGNLQKAMKLEKIMAALKSKL